MDWAAAKVDYERDGYIVPEFRLAEDTLEEIKQAHGRLIARFPRFNDYCPALLDYDLSFLDFARNPLILDMVEKIIGPDIILWNMSFFAKPARKGRKTPWHQDGEYWAIDPLATCTVWIAVDDSTVENGCLRIIPGSHKSQRLHPHTSNPSPDLTLSEELNASEFDENAAVDLTLEAGQLSLHDVYLFHESEPNLSDKPRRGMTMRFMPATSLFDREKESATYARFGKDGQEQLSIFLMRGEDRHGGNDFTLRAGIKAPRFAGWQ